MFFENIYRKALNNKTAIMMQILTNTMEASHTKGWTLQNCMVICNPLYSI